jgi:acetoacetyl-CoA synthetase
MPTPIWSPSPERVERANLSRFMRFVREETGNADLNSYAPLWQFSVEQPERFWTLLWDFCGIKASGSREPVLQTEPESTTGPRWFPAVRLNVVHNLLRFDDDRPAVGDRDRAGQPRRLSHAELRATVAAFAAALRADGIGSGDTVVAVLGNRHEALVAALGSAAVGAAFCALPPAPDALPGRLQGLQPTLLLSDDAEATAPGLRRIVRTDDAAGSGADPERIAWSDYLAAHADAPLDAASLPFEQPWLLLQSAGHAPVAHGAGGTLIQHLKELVLHVDLKREDRLLVAADIGSQAWCWALSALATGASLLLHAGPADAAGAAAMWNEVDEAGTTVLMLAPQWLLATAGAGIVPRERGKLLGLKTLVCDGALAPAALDFIYRDIKDRLYVAAALTQPGRLGAAAFGAPLLPVLREAMHCRALGMATEVHDADGAPVRNAAGTLVVNRPHPSLPLATVDAGPLRALLADNERLAAVVDDDPRFEPRTSSRAACA